jgi:phosphatidate phosphatase APP1
MTRGSGRRASDGSATNRSTVPARVGAVVTGAAARVRGRLHGRRRQSPEPDPQQALVAARAEDVVTRMLARFLRRAGLQALVLPYTGIGTVGRNGAPGWVRVFGRAVLSRRAGEDAARPSRRRGWRQFFTAPLFRGEVVVNVRGIEHRRRVDRQGYLDARIPADLAPGWHVVGLQVGDGPPTNAKVLVVDAERGPGIVSDIDDTVLVTSLPRPLIAAWNTFVRHQRARRPVEGMARLYRDIQDAHPNTPVVYLSTGAWNTWPALANFLAVNDYPDGPLLLTDWGPTQTGWFRSGPEHKERELDRLGADFPQVQWLLVGDDGQHDPRLYAEFAARAPDRVKAIAIRQLSPTEQVLAHGTPQPRQDAERPEDERTFRPVVRAGDGNGLRSELAREVPFLLEPAEGS